MHYRVNTEYIYTVFRHTIRHTIRHCNTFLTPKRKTQNSFYFGFNFRLNLAQIKFKTSLTSSI